MSNVYLLSIFTGAGSKALYSTLERAQEECAKKLELHGVTTPMVWVEACGDYALVPENWDQSKNVWGQNNTPDGECEDITISVLELDPEEYPHA